METKYFVYRDEILSSTNYHMFDASYHGTPWYKFSVGVPNGTLIKYIEVYEHDVFNSFDEAKQKLVRSLSTKIYFNDAEIQKLLKENQEYCEKLEGLK